MMCNYLHSGEGSRNDDHFHEGLLAIDVIFPEQVENVNVLNLQPQKKFITEKAT